MTGAVFPLIRTGGGVVIRGILLLLMSGCAITEVSPVPEGTALANCTAEFARRSGGSAQISDVRLLEGERGIITARTPFGVDYTCFTDAQGRAVNMVVDRPTGLFRRL